MKKYTFLSILSLLVLIPVLSFGQTNSTAQSAFKVGDFCASGDLCLYWTYVGTTESKSINFLETFSVYLKITKEKCDSINGIFQDGLCVGVFKLPVSAENIKPGMKFNLSSIAASGPPFVKATDSISLGCEKTFEPVSAGNYEYKISQDTSGKLTCTGPTPF